jgi:hypothetical protein
LSPQYDINDNESDERPAPFKPRLLRTKKKEVISKAQCLPRDRIHLKMRP